MDINSLQLIAGALLPLLVDLAKRVFKLESATAQKIVAGVLALCLALAAELSVRPFVSFPDLLGRFAVIFAASQVVYLSLLKDTTISKTISGK